MRKFLLIFFFVLPFIGMAKDEFPKKENKLVYDFTKNTLTTPQINALEQKLRKYNDSTTTQIAVVIIGSTGDYVIDDYGDQLFDKWGIGQKDKKNGILVLVAKEDRKMTIRIGYGLEPSATDALVKKIIDDEMTPPFKEGDFYAGLDNATTSLMALANKEFSPKAINEYMQRGRHERSSPYSFFIFAVLGIFSIVFFSKFRSVRNYASMNNIGFWAAWAILAASTNRSSGSWNNFNSGGGGFGGFSDGGGGGFGGFGGGSTGGGGASGSW